MWWRCQIGSNSPLANRNARMFCAASLPRKWSIRKICSSVEHLVQAAVQLPGRREVDPEGLLQHDPAVLDQVGIAQCLHDREGRLRRHAEVVQPAHLPVPLGLRVGHDAPQSLGALDTGRPAQQLRELGPGGEILRRPRVVAAELPHRLLGEIDERVSRVLVQRRADDPDVCQQAGLEQVQQTRQQLAAGQVAGGAEQNDGGRVESHAPSLPHICPREPCRSGQADCAG